MAKIILDESEYEFLKGIILLESIINPNELNESINLRELFNKYKKALAIGVAVSSIIFSINSLGIADRDKEMLKNKLGIEMTSKTDSLTQKKIDAVKKYMETALKNRNIPIENLQLSPEKIVQACQETGFDLPLLLAQAHLESCFGTTNRARNTNSVWSVGSYDNGKNVCTYNSQDDSIMPYIKLMQANYLSNKNVNDILQPGKFVNGIGKRYASDKNYENKVKSIRDKIIRQYPELA